MNIKLKKLLFFLATAIGFSSIFAQKKMALNTSLMDFSVKPREDFYRFVNGGWLKKNKIPADKKSWSVNDELQKKVDKDLLDIIKQAARNPNIKSNTVEGKVVNFYKTILDTIGRNKKGLSPLKPYLAKINAINNIKDLQAFLTEMAPLGGIGFFNMHVYQDERNRSRNAIHVHIGGFGLPDRNYYISTADKDEEVRNKYVLHVSRMLQFLGEKPVQAQLDAERILELETTLARAQLAPPANQLLSYIYNPMKVSDLQNLTPSIDWNAYLKDIGFKNVDSLIVREPKYMVALETIFKENKVEDCKAYLRYTLLRKSVESLSTKIETANWEFYGKFLNNEVKQKARDERALELINAKLGPLVGQLYVEKKFPLEAKLKAEKMVKNIVLAYQNRINNLTWMSAQTKIKALEKLKGVTFIIGYPNNWENNSGLMIKSPEQGGTGFENLHNISRNTAKSAIQMLNSPVDRSELNYWSQTVSYGYNTYDQLIVFMAAAMQPPFFNYQADEAINYGAFGGLIAECISYLFNNDSRYNIDGDLADWWTADDLKQFTVLSDRIVNQYSAIEPLPGIFLDGKNTLDRNVGDFAAVNVAYDALQLSLKENGRLGLIDGFTPEQRFFISWATIHRTKINDEELKFRLKWFPFSPEMYRSYVPLQNMDAFYEAFNVKSGDGMYVAPEKRVRIW